MVGSDERFQRSRLAMYDTAQGHVLIAERVRRTHRVGEPIRLSLRADRPDARANPTYRRSLRRISITSPATAQRTPSIYAIGGDCVMSGGGCVLSGVGSSLEGVYCSHTSPDCLRSSSAWLTRRADTADERSRTDAESIE
jgi:hypothetical protein